MTVKGSPFIMNDIAQQLEALNFHHKQKYAKLKHELFAKDDVITRLKQDIVDLQDKLSEERHMTATLEDELLEITGEI
jgi:hypothetical protein